MPNFRFGQQVQGNVYSLADSTVGNTAGRRRTPATAAVGSSPYGGGNSGGGGYQINRFNPAYDRLEEGSVIEDWIPRDLPGINKMLRILYTRDAICGPAVDIMANLPWSEFDLQGIEDKEIMRFYEEASQVFGDKAQEMPAITTEYLVLGRFCASLIYDESKGYWTDFVPHDSDFLNITPIPIRDFDPKIDLMLSPGMRQFVNSTDYRDQVALQQLPQHLIEKMRSGQPIPLDPLNTLYIRRKCSPYDFVGTSLFCVTGDSLVSTAKGLIRIDALCDHLDAPGEIEKVMTVATLAGRTAKTSHWVFSGVGDVVDVTTERGYTISGTLDHPVLCLEPSTLDMIWKNLRDVQINDLIAIALSDRLWPQESPMLDAVIAALPKHGRAVPVTLPRTMTTDLARVLGYLVSEGHVGRRIEFGNTNQEVVEDFRDAFTRAFPDAVLTDRTGNIGIRLLTCYNVHVLDFVRALIGSTVTLEKEIPDVILRSTKEHVSAFISALYEGDGSAAPNAVMYYSASENLLRQVQTVLLKYGIVSRRSAVEMKSGSHGRSGNLAVQGVFKDVFSREIGFRSATKNRFSANLAAHTVVTDVSTVEFVRALLDERTLDKNGRYRTDDSGIVQNDLRSDIDHRHVNVTPRNTDSFEKLMGVSAAGAAKVSRLDAIGYLWERVSTLTRRSDQPVYDLCVPETEAFVANGVVVHNTRIIPFWAVEKALMNATVTAARRRAGNILHVKAGIDDRWEPSQREMEDIAGLFIQSDEDPVGAVVVTRTGVEASEVREGGQLWKWSDEWETFSQGKMRGIGISEALLSGDACLAGDTLISTELGLLEIGQMRRRGDGPWQALGLNVASRYEPAVAAQWHYNGVKPVLLVRSSLGHEIRCTYNHPLLVLDGMETVWRRADQLKPGDLLCAAANQIRRTSALSLFFDTPSTSGRGGKRKVITTPTVMTPELGRLLGLILAEGCILKGGVGRSQVRLANTDRKVIDSYKSAVKEIFGIDSSDRVVFDPEKPGKVRKIQSHLRSWEAITCSKSLVDFLVYLGMVPSSGRSGACSKVVPWSILQADEISQRSFLAGFIEGDGSTAGDRITLLSGSPKMLAQLQAILGTHGIVGKQYDTRIELRGADSAVLWDAIAPFMLSKTFESKDAYKARNSVGFSAGPWRDLLAKRCVKTTNAGSVYVTDSGNTVTLSGVVKSLASDDKFLTDKYKNGCYTDLLASLKLISSSAAEQLESLLNCNYVFTPVASIEQAGEEPVFDLSMAPGAEPAFVANGIVSHNTYNNMEQARSVFTEQIRTLRTYLTQQVYYRRFKVLARAHGFRKRSQAELDHRVRIEKTLSSGGSQLLRDDQRGVQNLPQREALNIPDSDLIVPTLQWRKSLLPEGDKEYLELLTMLKEQGIPVPLRVWAARGGYDLDEALEMLDDDKKLRAKVRKWEESTGDGDEADGAAPTSAESPKSGFWDPGQRFLQLKKSEAKKVMQTLVNILNQPGKHEALADAGWVAKHVNGLLKNERKTELMSYVLMRMGIVPKMHLSAQTVSDIGDHFATASFLSMKKRMVELQTLAKLTATSTPTGDQIQAAGQRGLHVISPQHADILGEVKRASDSPELAPTAPTLLSGSVR
jgi:intein/homing endonuclease